MTPHISGRKALPPSAVISLDNLPRPSLITGIVCARNLIVPKECHFSGAVGNRDTTTAHLHGYIFIETYVREKMRV